MFLFVFQGADLFADDFSDCLELERLRARSDGATAKESVDQAEKICELKFNRGSSKGGSAESTEKAAGSAGINKPDFALDFMFGSKLVKVVDMDCKENGVEVYPRNACERHPANALLLDLFLTPQISLTVGSLSSVYEYPPSDRNVSKNYTTSEISMGGRLHLRKSKDRKGLDIYVGAGSVTIEACNKHEILREDGGGTIKVDFCGTKETGDYSEGGIKYVTRSGFSIGYYLRASSPEQYGGNTRGLTLGWTW